MNKQFMIIPLVISLCFVTAHLYAQSTKATLSLQDGTEFQVPDAGSIFIIYQAEGSSSFTSHTNISHRIHYYFEENEVETHRVIELSQVESMEFAANKENKSLIEQVKIHLWDGSQVIYHKLINAVDSIEEISPDGEKKAYKSTDFLCYRDSKSGLPWYCTNISANTVYRGVEKIRFLKYYKIKLIQFGKQS